MKVYQRGERKHLMVGHWTQQDAMILLAISNRLVKGYSRAPAIKTPWRTSSMAQCGVSTLSTMDREFESVNVIGEWRR
jgi:hypothetical protein